MTCVIKQELRNTFIWSSESSRNVLIRVLFCFDNSDDTRLIMQSSTHQTLSFHITQDKRGLSGIKILFLNKNICCGYSLEVPH